MKSIAYKKIRDVKSPERAYNTDAGLDFFIPNDSQIVLILPGKNKVIPSGIIISIPPNYMGLFLNKSGIASKHNLLVGAQVIDCGYTGEVNICLHNVGDEAIILEPGQKVVQLIIMNIAVPLPVEVNELVDYSPRGQKGFGSTDKYYCINCGQVEVNSLNNICIECKIKAGI